MTGTALAVIRRPARPRRDRRKALRLIGSGLQLGRVTRRADGTDVQEFQFTSGATGRFYPVLRDQVRQARKQKQDHVTPPNEAE